MKAMADAEMFEYIFWGHDLTVKISCNDLFYWGCADAEEIETEEDLDLFIQTFKDCKDICGELYCARKRKMRPQGAYYKYIPDEFKETFNACGPEREIDLGNPQDIKGKYLYKATN